MPSPFPAPPRPDLAPDRVATADFALRYEDVAQDGRMTAIAFPPALGWTMWAKLLAGHPSERALQAQGIVPILSRLTIVGTDATIRVDAGNRVGEAVAGGGTQLLHAQQQRDADRDGCHGQQRRGAPVPDRAQGESGDGRHGGSGAAAMRCEVAGDSGCRRHGNIRLIEVGE